MRLRKSAPVEMIRLTRIKLSAALCFTFVASLTAAQSKPTDAAAEAKRHRAELAAFFSIPQTMPIDDELRSIAQSMAVAHQDRLERQIAVWLQTDAPAQPGQPTRSGTSARAVSARFFNALTRWHVDSVDDDHRTTLVQAHLAPSVCAYQAGMSVFARRLLIWQAVPKERRSAFLKQESQLLERWFNPTTAVPQRPSVSLGSQIATAVDKLIEQDIDPDVPLPPAVAWELLRTDRAAVDSLSGVASCLLAQWALAQIASQPQAFAAHAFHVAPHIEDFYRDDLTNKEGGAPQSAYPRVAQMFEVEGKTVVEFKRDSYGKVSAPLVVQRFIKTPDLAQERPVAFERVFDRLSLARATDLPARKSDGSSSKPERVEFVWRLE
jgi:hypothetical protein